MQETNHTEDNIYLTGNYTYDEVEARVKLLEQITGMPQVIIRRGLSQFRKNSLASGRQFKYYEKYLEPRIQQALINYHGGHWAYFWKNSSLITKAFFFYVLIPPFLLCTLFFTGFAMAEDKISETEFILLALAPLILFVLAVAAYFLVLNSLMLQAIGGSLGLQKKKHGAMIRNLEAFEAGSVSYKFYHQSAIIIGMGGILKGIFIGKGIFKGMGGGKFGGGGASGSW